VGEIFARDARVAEEAADGMLTVERPYGPAVGAGGGGGGGREGGGRGGDGDEAAPETEMCGGMHAATVGATSTGTLTTR